MIEYSNYHWCSKKKKKKKEIRFGRNLKVHLSKNNVYYSFFVIFVIFVSKAENAKLTNKKKYITDKEEEKYKSQKIM